MRAVNGFGPVYTALLGQCAPLGRFAAPWEAIDPPADARGPVARPADLASALRSHLGPRGRRGRAAGVVERCATGRPALALVAWSVGTVGAAPPPELAPVVEHLTAARRHLGLALAGVGAWVPTPDELAAIRFALRVRDPAAAARLVRASAGILVD